MSIIIYLLIKLFIISSISASSSIIYPKRVCVIGDVQADYSSARDPRTLMGTYTQLDDINSTFDESIVDTSSPIYEHVYQGVVTGEQQKKTQYLFKVRDIGTDGSSTGWSLSETLPISGQVVTVFLTCFEDSLFDCIYNQWFWGYDKREYAIPTLKVLGGQCQSLVLYIFNQKNKYIYIYIYDIQPICASKT